MQEVKFEGEKFEQFKKDFAVFQEKNPAMGLDPNTGKIALGWDKLLEAFKSATKEEDGTVKVTIVGCAFSPIKTEDASKPSGWVPCSFKLGNNIYAVNAPTLFNGCMNTECPSTVLEFAYWWKQSKGDRISISKCENGDPITLNKPIRARVPKAGGGKEWGDVSTVTPKVIEWR